MGLPSTTCTSLQPVVDTLHLCFEITLTEKFLDAEKDEPRWKRLHQFEQRKGTLKGFAGYNWIALGREGFEGINVMWGPAKEPDQYPDRRRVRVMIGSAQCWRARSAGLDAYGLAVRVLFRLLGLVLEQQPPPEAVSVRRVDVAMDHWGYEWGTADLARFVTPARSRASVEEGERLDPDRRVFQGPETATYYVGSRGAASRMLRVYNKVAEAKTTGKLEWMERAWRAAGWDGTSTVWRAEIEHGGQWLHDHGFTDMTCLQGCERSLWVSYLGAARHVQLDRSRLERCSRSPVWVALSKAARSAPEALKRCPTCDGEGTHREETVEREEDGVVSVKSEAVWSCLPCQGTGKLGCWQWVTRAPTAGSDMERLLAQAAGCLHSTIEATRASFLQALPDDGSMGCLDGTEDDRDGEFLNLLQTYLHLKRAKEAAKQQCEIARRVLAARDSALTQKGSE